MTVCKQRGHLSIWSIHYGMDKAHIRLNTAMVLSMRSHVSFYWLKHEEILWLYLPRRVSHHDNLDGNGNRQPGFAFVIQLLHNEHDHHDQNGHHQVTEVGGDDLIKDVFQGLDKRSKRTTQRFERSLVWTVLLFNLKPHLSQAIQGAMKMRQKL